jgi:hypothetical protein
MRDAFTTVDRERAAADINSALGVVSSKAYLVSATAGVPRDLGDGNPLMMTLRVDTAFVGDATLQWGIIASNVEALSGGGSEIILAMSASIPGLPGSFGHLDAAHLTAGADFKLYIPPFPKTWILAACGLQYLGAIYLMTSGTSFTAGTFTTSISHASTSSMPRSHVIGYRGP